MSYNVKMNQNKILTTHTGSLPRPEELIKTMWALGDGIPVDNKILEERIAEAVYLTVEKQLNAGIDIINDGEMSKPSYATYVKDRLSGFGGESPENYFFADLHDFPKSNEIVGANPGRKKKNRSSLQRVLGSR
jgi:5-methyltetrahydropteroyltriglutamate--homocysteine methyltransferase